MKFTYQLKSFALRPLLEPESKSCITGIAGSGGLMVREGSLWLEGCRFKPLMDRINLGGESEGTACPTHIPPLSALEQGT